MAELSEKDKITLFGENYREVLAQAQAEGRTDSDLKKLWAIQIEKCRSNKFTAGAVTIVGAILALSEFFAVSGPSVLLVGLAGIAIFFLGIGWYWRLWSTLRRLEANPPA